MGRLLASCAQSPGLTPALHTPGVGAPVIPPLRGGDKGVQGDDYIRSPTSPTKDCEKNKKTQI